MKNSVLQLLFQGRQLEILQNSFDICGGDGTVGKVTDSWMNWHHAAAQHYYVYEMCKFTM